MKTKTITKEFYTSKGNLEAIKSIKNKGGFIFDRFYLNDCNINSGDVKITITYEVSEKKVEITESQFDKLAHWAKFGSNPIEYVENIRKEIFGE